MLVALHRQHDLFAAEALLQRRGGGRLRFVPLAIVRGSGMDVVRGLIVVLDLDILARHYSEHVGMILASLLIESYRVFGNVKCASAEAVLHVHEHIGQIAAGNNHGFGGVGAFAGCVLAHVNLGGLGCCAVELDGAADAGHGVGVNGSGGGRCCGGGGGWVCGGGVFFFAGEVG